MRSPRCLLSFLVAFGCAAGKLHAAEPRANNPHIAALRARIQQHKQAIARTRMLESVTLDYEPWQTQLPGLYRALIAHHATFLDPAAPHVVHDQVSWKLTIGPYGLHVSSPQGKPPTLDQALEQMGIRDEAAFSALLLKTLRNVAPDTAAEFRSDGGLIRGVERATREYAELVFGLTNRPDSLLLREYFRDVTRKLDVHSDGIDIGRAGVALLLNNDDHITYAGNNQPPSNAGHRRAIRSATELELKRAGLLDATSFDAAVQRTIVDLAGLKTKSLSPAVLSKARLLLQARIAEVRALDEHLADPNTHEELALLSEIGAAQGWRSMLPLASKLLSGGRRISLSLARIGVDPQSRIYWQSTYSSKGGLEQANVSHLVDFGVDTKPAFDAMIREKLLNISPEQIP